MSFVFAFMAADYALWMHTPAGQSALSNSGAPAPPPLGQQQWGPASLKQWLKFWQMSGVTTFNPAYLYAWGAR